MQRRRTIAAAPIRSASEAWKVVVALLTDTLERSPDIVAGEVEKEMAPLAGLGPALIAAGHLENDALVVSAEPLDVSIYVVTGDSALGVDENLGPVPGGASASADWTVQVPAPGPLAAAVAAATNGSTHLVTATTAVSTSASAAAGRRAATTALVDADAIRELGGRP